MASRGYLVVTIDHTYDSSEVEFPGGRVVDGLLNHLFQQAQQPGEFQTLARKVFDVRIADTRFVLDQLAALNRGTNPDPGTDHRQTPSWKMLWDNSAGWHVDVHLNGAKGEDSYKDTVPLIPQIARQLGLPDNFVTGNIGSIDLTRAVHSEETFVAAFFDRWLRGWDGQVLDGPSPSFPDVTFIA